MVPAMETSLIVTVWEEWAEAGDAAEHVTMLRTASTAKNSPVQNVNGANVEKP